MTWNKKTRNNIYLILRDEVVEFADLGAADDGDQEEVDQEEEDQEEGDQEEGDQEEGDQEDRATSHQLDDIEEQESEI